MSARSKKIVNAMRKGARELQRRNVRGLVVLLLPGHLDNSGSDMPPMALCVFSKLDGFLNHHPDSAFDLGRNGVRDAVMHYDPNTEFVALIPDPDNHSRWVTRINSIAAAS